MNPDKLAPGERAASTSNRNFEGRQGKGGRTHLVSPAVAAATAIAGHFAAPDGPGLRSRSRWKQSARSSPGRSRSTGPTWTPTRSSRPTGSSGSSAPGFGEGLFSEWRERSDFVLNQSRYDGATHPRRRAQLRHRLVARARAVGAAGLRVPGDHLAPLRRHLPQQLPEDRPGPGRRCPSPSSPGSWRRSRTTRRSRSSSTSSTGGSRSPRSTSTSRSSSTTTPTTACSTGSTTSGSPSSAATRSAPSRRDRAPWLPVTSAT